MVSVSSPNPSPARPDAGAASVDPIIGRWSGKDGGERANYQLFIHELCGILGVPGPRPKSSDAAEGRPPFLIVADVGHCIELYAEFSRSGGVYTPFPDARSHRIHLDDLRRPEIRERLRLVWTDPLSLDPARRTAAVTRDVAAKLAALAKSLEKSDHEPKSAAENSNSECRISNVEWLQFGNSRFQRKAAA
ncbi:MAG: hypothetical protein JJU00_19225 [Opitutales bacterium]|nr:hypothetical protein [Opitutales bacterium]